MSDQYSEVEVREARKEDMAAVLEMIQELADFEKMPDGPKMKLEELERDGFESSPPSFRCMVAALACPARPPARPPARSPLAGYALYFPTYSTWQGRALMLEDLYVRPEHRRRGLGRRLFDAVAKHAVAAGCSRLDFHVLEWNPARAFYDARGAQDLTRSERWCCYRLAGAALAAAAAD